jgi:hypothetical protein
LLFDKPRLERWIESRTVSEHRKAEGAQ